MSEKYGLINKALYMYTLQDLKFLINGPAPEININFEDNYEDKEYNCEKIMIQSMHHSNI